MKQATVAAIRFGFGLSPQPQPATPEQVFDALARPDSLRETYPMVTAAEAQALRREISEQTKARRDKVPGAADALDQTMQRVRDIHATTLRQLVARQLDAVSPLRERLNMFWLDHFTTRIRNVSLTQHLPVFLDSTLRTHMTGHFGDLLRAVIVDPQMVLYLDQDASVGPMSKVGRKRGLGLNENLARELLELHSLGVGGGYTQTDVHQLAELLAGLTYRRHEGTVGFRKDRAEPGAETILGQPYGGKRSSLGDIFAALDDIAVHPDTARHMARKLAVHFVSDTPDPALIAHIEGRWRDTGGDLMQVYGALLEHPAAWSPTGQKVKQPHDFVVSTLRALGVTGADLWGLNRNAWRDTVPRALRDMGQPFMRAPGPDGWPEGPEAWITPVGLSSRIRWAMRMPPRLVKPLPDPRDFLARALDDAASPQLTWAVGAADTVAQGVGLVLASPEFNRR